MTAQTPTPPPTGFDHPAFGLLELHWRQRRLAPHTEHEDLAWIISRTNCDLTQAEHILAYLTERIQ